MIELLWNAMGLSRRQPWRIAYGISALLFAVYLLSYSGQIHAVDEAYMLAVTESFGKGRLDVNQIAFLQWGSGRLDDLSRVGTLVPSGDVFCKKGIGVSLLALPLLWSSSVFPWVGAVHATLLTNAILTALTGGILFTYLLSLGFSLRTSLACSLVFGLGTLAWPYARWFFSEPATAMGLLLALYGCSLFHRASAFRPAFLCGLGSGIAIFASPASIIVLPILLGGLVSSAILTGRKDRRWCRFWRSIGGWWTGLAGPLIVVLIYNWLRFEFPWDTGWHLSIQNFNLPLYKGLLGLLVSPARGLLFYSPVLLLMLPGLFIGYGEHKFACSLITIIFGIYLGFYAKWEAWHGGWSWGPRYLVPVLPLTIVPIAEVWEFISTKRSMRGYVLVLLLVIISIFVQMVSVGGNYIDVEFALRNEFSAQGDEWFYRGREVLFNLAKSPLVLQAQNILQGHLDWSWIVWGRVDGLTLGVSVLGLIAGMAILWSAYASPQKFRTIAFSTSLVLLLSALIVVTRATARPFYNTEPDGRLDVLSHVVRNNESGDALISVVPYLYELMMDRYPNLPPVYGLPRDQKEHPETLRLLEQAVRRHSRLWFLSVWTHPADSNNRTELWLTTHAFPLNTWEFGGYRLTLFIAPTEPESNIFAGVTFADLFRLERFAISRKSREQSTILQLTLEWRSLRSMDKDYQIFVHAYDQRGRLVGQADHSPVGGFYPTSTWPPGELVQDRIALELPPELDTGNYRLAVGLYDWRTGERLSTFSEPDGIPTSDGCAWLILSSKR